MKQSVFEIITNRRLTDSVFELKLAGDVSEIKAPGQFVNVSLEPYFLRRPISVCDVNGSELTLVYKTVGKGTEYMSGLRHGAKLDLLTGLGNGYDLSLSGENPLLLGGGVGLPPLYYLAKKLVESGKNPILAAGFNTKDEIFYGEEFKTLGVRTVFATLDGSEGVKGYVTDAIKDIEYSYFYACGPLPMLKAIYKNSATSGQFSLEERMACGFGVCMGCTHQTKNGNKRVCKDGPVFVKEELLW